MNKRLRKKDYMNTKKANLKKGAILPIYQDWKTEESLMGFARLNYKVSKPKEELTFERISVGNNALVLYRYQRWNITYVDPAEFNPDVDHDIRWKFIGKTGFTHNWNIAYFETVNSNYKS